MSIQPLRRGFVLHRRDYRNSSLLLDLFTADEGRIVCVAKGAKASARGRSALASLLQPFQPLWLSWFGRGEVKTLARAEAAGPSLALSGERLYCGFYLNELLMRLIERHDVQEGLFVFYQQALADLEAEPIEALLRRFELRLLEELGYALDLSADRRGEPIMPAGWYRYHPSLGFERMPDRAPEVGPDAGPKTVIEANAPGARSDAQSAGEPAVLINGVTLARLAAGEALQPADRAPARALMRAALAPHLGPKPLRSRELFRRRSG
jgi:DNA repair protein RecO (recombination protein O)